MHSHSKTKYFSILLLIILLALGYWFLSTREKPYKLENPESFEVGTELSVYKKFPPSFPKEFFLGEVRPDYSGQIKTPDGKNKITVSFSLSDEVIGVVNTYRKVLAENGWTLTIDTLAKNFAILRATKGDMSVFVSLDRVSAFETLITVQYEK